ncbi:ARPC1B [Symbiodinium sp. KB8]|nr:ARPC1B [Symbiodinium sp. KB8]
MSMAERRASGEARRSLPGRGYPKSAPKATEAEAASEEEETASDESDDEVQPGSRPRVAAAGLCTTAQAQALGEAPKEVASEQLSKLREELKASAAAEARANEACEELRHELAAAKEAEVEAAARAEQLRADLAAAKESEVEAVACAEQLRADLAAAKEGQVEAAACAEQLRADLAAAKEGEASKVCFMNTYCEHLDLALGAAWFGYEDITLSVVWTGETRPAMKEIQDKVEAMACAEQLRADLAAAKEGEAQAAACAEKLRADLAAAKESQAESTRHVIEQLLESPRLVKEHWFKEL